MLLKISQLKSFQNFKKFLQRKLKGCLKQRGAKLINHLYSAFCSGYQVEKGFTYITAKQYFGKVSGFRVWINALFNAGVVQRVGGIRSSRFRLGAVGRKYLQKIFDERLALNETEFYKEDITVVNKPKGVEVDVIMEELKRLREKMDTVLGMLTPEQEQEVERHLKLVKDE